MVNLSFSRGTFLYPAQFTVQNVESFLRPGAVPLHALIWHSKWWISLTPGVHPLRVSIHRFKNGESVFRSTPMLCTPRFIVYRASVHRFKNGKSIFWSTPMLCALRFIVPKSKSLFRLCITSSAHLNSPFNTMNPFRTGTWGAHYPFLRALNSS